MAIDFADLMLPVAERLLGPPNKSLSTSEEKRWGTKGSLAVNVKKGVWTDFETNEGGGCLDFIKRYINGGDPIAWVRENHFIQNTEIVSTFDYVDENNVLLYQACRKADGTFLQRRPDGRRWIYSVRGIRHVPYRLPELLADTSDKVWITEGEKHADRLR